MQKRRRTRERRYRKKFEDGREEYTPWEIVSDVEDEVVIGKFDDRDAFQTQK